MKETDLAKPVADWLRSEGFTVYSEVPFWHRCIDMVGLIKPDIVRIVELKVRYNKKGVRQAMLCQLATNDVYLAVTNKPLVKSIETCTKYGVGLLQVNNTVTVLTSPVQQIAAHQVARDHLIENCIEPSDEAGLPFMSGCGPAQAVGAFVRQYVKEHPKATWREIFNNVPNHYCNYQSMAGAMAGYLGLTLTKLRPDGAF